MKLDFDTDGGIGSRAVMGLIVLQADETIEHEFRHLMPDQGVALYHSRIVMPADVNPRTLVSMKTRLPEAAGMLPAIRYDVIGYGCTSGATMIGSAEVAAAIGQVHPGVQVSDPITAVVAACRALNIHRVGFVTPYVAEVSAAMRALLEQHGLRIAGFGSFEQGDDQVVARIAPGSVMWAIESVAAMEDCDGVFVSCTNLRVAGIVAEAERRIAKPVISSNLALAWHMQRLAGLQPQAQDCGALFQN